MNVAMPDSSEFSVRPGFGSVIDAFRHTLDDDGRTGASLAVWVDGEPVVEIWGGTSDRRRDRSWSRDTLSVIFSCTKGLAAVMIGMLVERGDISSLETPVAAIWPAFAPHAKGEITVADALAHRAGVSAPRRHFTLDEALDGRSVAAALAAQEPLWQPGTTHSYHALTYGFLAEQLILRSSGRSAGRFFAADVAGPLGADAWIGLPSEQEDRVSHLVQDNASAVSEFDADPEAVHWVTRGATLGGALPPELVSPTGGFNDPVVHRAELAGAGGIATASALARIWSATVTETRGTRLVSDDTAEALAAPRSSGKPRYVVGPPPYPSWGAGVMVPSPAQPFLSPRSFGHDGAGGQVAFADPDAKVGFAYLTNQIADASRAAHVLAVLRRVLG